MASFGQIMFCKVCLVKNASFQVKNVDAIFCNFRPQKQ